MIWIHINNQGGIDCIVNEGNRPRQGNEIVIFCNYDYDNWEPNGAEYFQFANKTWTDQSVTVSAQRQATFNLGNPSMANSYFLNGKQYTIKEIRIPAEASASINGGHLLVSIKMASDEPNAPSVDNLSIDIEPTFGKFRTLVTQDELNAMLYWKNEIDTLVHDFAGIYSISLDGTELSLGSSDYDLKLVGNGETFSYNGAVVATEGWVGDNYLPLIGGTLSGPLTVNGVTTLSGYLMANGDSYINGKSYFAQLASFSSGISVAHGGASIIGDVTVSGDIDNYGYETKSSRMFAREYWNQTNDALIIYYDIETNEMRFGLSSGDYNPTFYGSLGIDMWDGRTKEYPTIRFDYYNGNEVYTQTVEESVATQEWSNGKYLKRAGDSVSDADYTFNGGTVQFNNGSFVLTNNQTLLKSGSSVVTDSSSYITANGSVTTNGSLTAYGTVTANGNFTANGDLTTNGNVTMNTGNATFNNGFVSNGDVTFNKREGISDDLYFNIPVYSTMNIACLNSNLGVNGGRLMITQSSGVRGEFMMAPNTDFRIAGGTTFLVQSPTAEFTKNVSVGQNLTVTGNASIGGDLTVSGTITSVDAETLSVGTRYIQMMKGNTVAVAGFVGSVIPKYDGTNDFFFGVKEDTMVLGDVTATFNSDGDVTGLTDISTVPLMAREGSAYLDDGDFLIWDATGIRAVGIGAAAATNALVFADDEDIDALFE